MKVDSQRKFGAHKPTEPHSTLLSSLFSRRAQGQITVTSEIDGHTARETPWTDEEAGFNVQRRERFILAIKGELCVVVWLGRPDAISVADAVALVIAHGRQQGHKKCILVVALEGNARDASLAVVRAQIGALSSVNPYVTRVDIVGSRGGLYERSLRVLFDAVNAAHVDKPLLSYYNSWVEFRDASTYRAKLPPSVEYFRNLGQPVDKP